MESITQDSDEDIDNLVNPTFKWGFLFYEIFINMKKIVRLTESDLARIVKKVVKEQDEDEVVVGSSDAPKEKNDYKTIMDKRGKEDFLISLERITNKLKEPAKYSTWNKNTTFFGDQLPEFKRQLDILFTEIQAQNPQY